MINAGRIIAVSALLLAGTAGTTIPAEASVPCGTSPSGVVTCWDPAGSIPAPPPGYIAPLGPPPLAGDKPWDGHSPFTYPTPKQPAAPAPVYHAPAPAWNPPAAPAPVYQPPAAPAPVYVVPVPVYGQPAAPEIAEPSVPDAGPIEVPAAPESVQDEPTPAATPVASPRPSATHVATAAVHDESVPVMLRGVRGAYSGSLVMSQWLRALLRL